MAYVCDPSTCLQVQDSLGRLHSKVIHVSKWVKRWINKEINKFEIYGWGVGSTVKTLATQTGEPAFGSPYPWWLLGGGGGLKWRRGNPWASWFARLPISANSDFDWKTTSSNKVQSDFRRFPKLTSGLRSCPAHMHAHMHTAKEK